MTPGKAVTWSAWISFLNPAYTIKTRYFEDAETGFPCSSTSGTW
jgi:hypothetical protein